MYGWDRKLANPKVLDTFIAHIAKFNCPGMPHLPQNRLYQCGLARAVAPDNHGEPATVDMEIDMLNKTSVYDMFASYISNIPVFLRRSRVLKERILQSLSMFEAQGLIDRQLGELSGGELQRVLLSIACDPVPNLLLLDEPVSGIDRNGMELFYENISALKKNCDLAMILVSHDLDYVEKYADNVILLDKTVLKEGTPAQVFASREFHEVFG